MKARQIRALRKKIAKKDYFRWRWAIYAHKCKEWHEFYRFKCVSAFVGREMATYNTAIYDKKAYRDYRKCEWYQKKVEGDKEYEVW